MGFVQPWHSFFVHFSVTLGFLLPLVSGYVWWRIRERDYRHETWRWVVVCSVAYLVSLLLSIALGHYDFSLLEGAEELYPIMSDHRTKSYIVCGMAFLLCALAFLGRDPKRRKIRQGFFYFALLNIFPLLLSISSGSGLIYDYNLPRLFIEKGQ